MQTMICDSETVDKLSSEKSIERRIDKLYDEYAKKLWLYMVSHSCEEELAYQILEDVFLKLTDMIFEGLLQEDAETELCAVKMVEDLMNSNLQLK